MPQYQGIWTLPQQSQAQANQQWVTDPKFKETVLLLQADGTGNGSQNSDFKDSSPNGFYVQRTGQVPQGSFSPFSRPDGQWSNYFSGGYLRTTSSTALGFSTNAFTIEAWVFMTDRAAQYYLVGGSGVSSQVSIKTDGTLIFGVPGVGDITASTGTVPLNEWTHIAYVRSSTSSNGFAYYINGIQSGTATLSTDLGTSSATVEVGTTNTGVGVTSWTGYISNVRVIKGTALYTSNFIPSTKPLTSISGTSLLTCQSNRFIDNSSNNAIFTIGSTTTVRVFSPFAPARQWTPEVVGGSAYFDGSGDNIYFLDKTQNGSSSQLDLGSIQASADFWVYPTAASSAAGLYKQVYSPSDWNGQIWYQINIYDSGNITIYYRSGSNYAYATWAITGPYFNQWNHIVFATDASNNISVFLNGTRIINTTGTIGTNTSTNYISFGTTGAGLTGAPYTGYMTGLRFLRGTSAFNAASSTITVPTAIQTVTSDTQLLMNFANAGIYDSTCQTNWETKALKGGTYVDTVIKKNGSGSFYFDGTQAYAATERILPAENYPSLIFRTGDFTIETWLYCIGKPTNSTISGIWDQRPGVNGTYINWVVDFGGYGGAAANPTLVLYADSATRLRSDVIPLQRWFHAVLCRSNGYTSFFIDGKLACTPLADTRDYGSGGSAGNFRPVIGQTDGGDAFYGFMDDFRATRSARYVSNFTPPQQALPRQ